MDSTRKFYLLLSGQVVSQAGGRMTGFALGVWTYQTTGSVALYASIVLAMLVPGIVLAPASGVITDRWDRLRILLLAHVGGGICAVALALGHRIGALGIGLVALLLLLKAAFESLATLALAALTAALVPTGRLNRANGLMQLGLGLSMILAPVAAASLLPLIGMGWIFLINLVTAAIAASAVLLLRGARIQAGSGAGRAARSPLQEAAAGFVYLRRRRDLTALLGLLAIANFDMGMGQVLFAPLILTLADARTLGVVESIGGAGMLLGGGVLAAWGGPRRPADGVIGFMLLLGAVLLTPMVRTSVTLAAAGIFGFLFAFPFIAGCGQTIWQRETPQELQGRVFAVRLMVANATMALASIVAGPLADKVFEPLLTPGGPLAGSVGRIVGVGPGRGVAMLLATLGLVTFACAALAPLAFPLRRLGEVGPRGAPPEATSAGGETPS